MRRGASVSACLSLQHRPQQSLHLSLLGAKKNCSYDSKGISEKIFNGSATPPSLVLQLNHRQFLLLSWLKL